MPFTGKLSRLTICLSISRGIILGRDFWAQAVKKHERFSPADKSGIEPDEIITAVGDIEILTTNDLVNTINLYEVGDTI